MIFYLSIVSSLLTCLTNKGTKVLPHLLGYNKTIIMSNIAITHGGGGDFRDLIKHFNLKELNVLKQDEELIERVSDISKLGAEDIQEYMLKEWGLVAESCQNDDWWVDIDGMRDRIPKWARAVIEGTYVSGDDFVDWGRARLMEEVRVNVNIKIIEELREVQKKKAQEELERQYSEACMYGAYGICL